MNFSSDNVTGVTPQIMAALAGADLVHAIEANEIFVRLPEGVMNALSAGGVGFQRWGNDGQARFVCAFNTDRAAVARTLEIARNAT